MSEREYEDGASAATTTADETEASPRPPPPLWKCLVNELEKKLQARYDSAARYGAHDAAAAADPLVVRPIPDDSPLIKYGGIRGGRDMDVVKGEWPFVFFDPIDRVISILVDNWFYFYEMDTDEFHQLHSIRFTGWHPCLDIQGRAWHWSDEYNGPNFIITSVFQSAINRVHYSTVQLTQGEVDEYMYWLHASNNTLVIFRETSGFNKHDVYYGKFKNCELEVPFRRVIKSLGINGIRLSFSGKHVLYVNDSDRTLVAFKFADGSSREIMNRVHYNSSLEVGQCTDTVYFTSGCDAYRAHQMDIYKLQLTDDDDGVVHRPVAIALWVQGSIGMCLSPDDRYLLNVTCTNTHVELTLWDTRKEKQYKPLDCRVFQLAFIPQYLSEEKYCFRPNDHHNIFGLNWNPDHSRCQIVLKVLSTSDRFYRSSDRAIIRIASIPIAFPIYSQIYTVATNQAAPQWLRRFIWEVLLAFETSIAEESERENQIVPITPVIDAQSLERIIRALISLHNFNGSTVWTT